MKRFVLFFSLVWATLAGCVAQPTAWPPSPTSQPLPSPTIGYQPFTPTPSETPGFTPGNKPGGPIATRTLGISVIPQTTKTIGPTMQAPVESVPGAGCIPVGDAETGRVVEILSGDLIRVFMNDATFSVRLIGVRAPQNDRFYTAPARLEAATLLYGKDVRLFRDVTDVADDKSLPRYVIADNRFVNLTLVEQGAVAAVDVPPDSACAEVFASAQSIAESEALGLWYPTPYEPYALEDPVCDCSRDRYNCTRQFFFRQRGAQACFDYCNYIGAGDVHGLDRDGNGVACDSMLTP